MSQLLTNLRIGRSGLRAATAAIEATTHNVANASTEGFTTRRASLAVADPIGTQGYLRGQGVQVLGIERPDDKILQTRTLLEAGNTTSARQVWTQLQALERLYDSDTTSPPRERLRDFFDSLNAATSDPADPSLRRGVLQAADNLAGSVRREAESYLDALDEIDARIGATLPEINDKLRRVADLNDALQAASGELVRGDLADQRATLLRDLAELAGVTADLDADGGVSVFVGGHAVVQGDQVRPLAYDDTQPTPVVVVDLGAGQLEVTDAIGGTVGGLLESDARIRGYLAELDVFADAFAAALNAQHALGFDRSGTAGGDLFDVVAGTEALSFQVNAALLADPDLLAFAGDAAGNAGDTDNLLSLLLLEDQDLIAGTQTAGEYLTRLTGQLGADVNAADSLASTQESVLLDLDELTANLYGVDLDEEAQNLLLYQTAYQSSARVLSVMDGLLGDLLQLV